MFPSVNYSNKMKQLFSRVTSIHTKKNLGVLYKASQNVEKHSNKLKYNCDENIQCLNVAAALSDSPIVTLLHTILCRMRRSVLAVVASVDTCSLVRCSSSLRLTP